MTSAHELLVEGRKFLARGWTQGILRTWDSEEKDRKYCLIGCVVEARDRVLHTGQRLEREERVNILESYEAALEAMKECVKVAHPEPNLPTGEWSIARYNDDEDRTHEDVLAVIDCAIRRTETELTQEVGHGG